MGIQFVGAVTDATFQEKVLEESWYKPVVVDFWAEWCGPCLAMTEPFAETAEKAGDNAVFVKLNIDENQQTALAWSVMSIPTFIVFVDGKPALGAKGQDVRIVGSNSQKNFEKKLAAIDERIFA